MISLVKWRANRFWLSNGNWIYLWHNSVNGKQYGGSGYKLSDRLAEYYHPSKLSDNRYIYNSIWKYGHDNFSYYWVGSTGTITEKDCLAREQYYFDLYEPVLNTNKRTDSTLGFKHTETSERLIPDEVYKIKIFSHNPLTFDK